MDWVYSCANYFLGPRGGGLKKNGATVVALAWASSNFYLMAKGNEWFPGPHAQVIFSREKLHKHYMSSVRLARKNVGKKLDELDGLLDSLIPIPSPADIKNAEKGDRRALWNQMLHGFFARAVASVYCVCALSISYQLSWIMLGKYMYLRAIFGNSPLVVKDVELTEDQQAAFSSQMVDTLMKSLSPLILRCLEVAKEVLAGVSLKERWNADDVTGFITAIRHKIEEETQTGDNQWYFDSFSPRENGPDEKVDLLLNETRNTVNHPQFGGVMSIVVEGLFSSVLDQMESSVFSEQKMDPKGTIVAALLPKLKKFGDAIVYSPEFFPNNLAREEFEEGGLASPFSPVQAQTKAVDCVLMSTHLNWFLFEELYSDIPDCLAQASDS